MRSLPGIGALGLAFGIVATVPGAAPGVEATSDAAPTCSPYAGRSYPIRPFLGDTHLHTSFSMDAGA